MRGLTLLVVVAGEKVEKVLSGTDELLRVAGTWMPECGMRAQLAMSAIAAP